jgi:hypothetical protein
VAKPALSEAGPLAFPDTQVGSASAAHTVTLGNSGTAALKITSLVLNGAQASDFVLGGSCAANAVVNPSSSCSMEISFKPTGAGQRAAMAVLMTDSGSQFTLVLGGTGVAVPVPQLTVNPQSFDFGPASVDGTAATHRITVTNTGSNPARLTSATFTGPFALQTDSSGCAAFPFTLAPGAACDLVVGFAPVSGGVANGSMALSADGGAPLTVALSGSGNVVVVQAPQNRGGGGCSSITGGNDPVLALLVVVSIGVLLWRRYGRKQEPQS